MLESARLLPLPPVAELEVPRVLGALNSASRALAELKGRVATIPNQDILIDTLSLQEAKASSEIENIVTTHDELFQVDLFPEENTSGAAKEVARYRDALKLGYRKSLDNSGRINNDTLIEMYRLLIKDTAGFRTKPGTYIVGARGETIYVPPQDAQEIKRHMADLEEFINTDDACALDPLIKMALIHHQFESIHPFYDGNGRIGRILNVLYLTRTGLLDSPVLYLSRAINSTRPEYYRLLRAVHAEGAWEDWVVYMLDAVTVASRSALELVSNIHELMLEYKRAMREKIPEIYSQDLLNNLFQRPYTRIDFIEQGLGRSRPTAAKYLNKLVQHGFVREEKIGRRKYYINTRLVNLFLEVADR